jgi:hypothetical protein
MKSKIIQDVSHYQQYIDFELMKSLGQNYMFIKCASGNGKVDVMWESHYKNGTDAGINIIPYFWEDPIEDAITQSIFFLKTISNKNVPFIVIDMEQWWSSWELWEQNLKDKSIIVPKFSKNKLFSHFKIVYEYLVNNISVPVVVYTANWFVQSYLPIEAWTYLENIYTWWADYTLFNINKEKKTWEQLETLVPTTNIIPTLPKSYNTDKVLIWQFSGDKFMADGVYANVEKTRLSALDLNKWVNKDITIEQITGGSTIVNPPVEDEELRETFKKSTKFVGVLNVPYISQLGVGAEQHHNDCGAACSCMVISGYKDAVPTVDEFYDKAQSSGDVYLSASQMISTMRRYGVNTDWYISNIETLKKTLLSGRPIICLILYKTLVDAKIVQSTFKGYHFVLVVGYDIENIYVNDPLSGGEYLEIPIDIFNQCWKDAGTNPSINPAYGCIVATDPIGKNIQIYDKYAVTSYNGLNVRSSPVVKNNPSNVIGVMKYNEQFEVISIDNGWGKIVTGGYCSITYAEKIS